MPVTKKNTSLKTAGKKTIIVTKTKIESKEPPFAKKLEKVNNILSKTKWLD